MRSVQDRYFSGADRAVFCAALAAPPPRSAAEPFPGGQGPEIAAGQRSRMSDVASRWSQSQKQE